MPLLALVGTTDEGRHRLSIHRASSDRVETLAEAELPSPPQALIVDATRRLLVARAGDPGGHALDVFAFRGDLALHHSQPTLPVPVHLAADAGRVAVSHYRGGEVVVHDWPAGGPLVPTRVIEGFGSSVHERQRSSHAHAALLAGDDVYVADFGADAVRRYRDGALQATWAAPPGSGPRHLVRLPGGTIALVCELSSTVHLLDGSTLAERGAPAPSLPPGFVSHNQASDIQLLADDRTLVVGHRGLDALAVHRLDDRSGPAVDWMPLRGAPRVIAVGPRRLIAVACEDNGWVQVLEHRSTSGFREQAAFQVGTSAVAVQFLPAA